MAQRLTTLLAFLFFSTKLSVALHSPNTVVRRLRPVQTSRTFLPSQNQHGRASSSSVLFSSPSKDNKSPNKGGNPFHILRRAVTKLSVSLARFSAKFVALSNRAKIIILAQLLFVVVAFGGLARSSQTRKVTAPVELPFSQFMDLIEQKGTVDDLHVLDVKVGTDRLGFQIARGSTTAELKALKEYKEGKNPTIPIPSRAAYTRKIAASPELIDYLRRNRIPFRAETKVSNASLASLTARGALMSFYLFYMWKIMKSMSGGGSSTPGKLANVSDLPNASFSEIQGIDDAKFEVMELVDTLRNPDKYAILGARAPKGLLLEGPPGTGKTLLARATAATAGVPLLYCSGSDFVEMFVGRGAARVRKTFEKAEKLAPCLIFIDELDALGKSRDTGMMANMRGNDEAEQTLNQLLACMDGLDNKGKQICVMAATNRREVLDSALLRPGRFDRIVRLELPGLKGREAILRVHASRLPGFKECYGTDPNRPGSFGNGDAIDLSTIAFATPGCSGAELEFIVNEAAIRAVRRVSAALRDGKTDPASVTANVIPQDFEESVRSFYSSRKKNGGGVGDMLSNVWKA